jgi:hypothetical protein
MMYSSSMSTLMIANLKKLNDSDSGSDLVIPPCMGNLLDP